MSCGIAPVHDVALADSAPGDFPEQFDPAAQQTFLQLLRPADRLEQVERRARDVFGDVGHRDQVRDVDQRFQPGQLPAEQFLHRGAGLRGLLVDNRECQRVLGAEMEIHRALGQLRFGQNVVEADRVIRALGELVCRGSQNLLARRV